MRPRSIAGIAGKPAAGSFDPAVREFLDAWQEMNREERQKALSVEPACLGSVKDAYLAALAEHLSLSEGFNPPAWCQDDNRFLREPFFAGGLESLKAILLVESPLAFRRRLIFISADALFRPARRLVEDDAASDVTVGV
jgi:hypothetical protein